MIIPGSTYTNERRSIYRLLMRNDDNTLKHINGPGSKYQWYCGRLEDSLVMLAA